MAGSLVDYVLRLSRDPDEVAKFRSSREAAKAAMLAADLSDDHQDALLSGDPERISQALSAELGDVAAGHERAVGVNFSCNLVMPGL